MKTNLLKIIFDASAHWKIAHGHTPNTDTKNFESST